MENKNINLIAAMDENYLIGKKDKLPWDRPNDLNLFKELTTDNIIIMGRKTHESIGRLLPNRINIIISKTLEETLDSEINEFDYEELKHKLIVYNSLEKALEISKNINLKLNIKKSIYIIGGEQIYKEAMRKNLCEILHISHIEGRHEGDTYFPFRDFSKYEILEEKKYEGFIYKKYKVKK